MKRYCITEELRAATKNCNSSLDTMNATLGFEVRNILYGNTSIREDHLAKLSYVRIENHTL